MDPTPQPRATNAPPSFSTLMLASANLLNFARPGRVFYPNQDPYDDAEYQRKLAWIGGMFGRLSADVIGVQEVWDESALKAAAAASGQRGYEAHAPGAEASAGGAQGTPRVGLVTRLAVEQIDSIATFAPNQSIHVPEIGEHARFERPVLRARLRLRQGGSLVVLVAHLKSKRPKFLQDAAGRIAEDADDPAVVARATLRSLLMRAAEALALRQLVVEVTHRANEQAGPLVLMGDLNDTPNSVTSQMIAATQAVAYDKAARDVALYHAWDVATEPALRRDMAYSHVHQGWPELLDQIWVSEEFVAGSRFAIGDVKRVEVFNDHLHETRERWRSDHGFVRALLRVRDAR